MSDFWIFDPKILLQSVNIIPDTDTSVEEQLNAVTRLVVLLSMIITILYNLNIGIQFLIFSLLFIIILYFIKIKKTMNNKNTQETFQSCGYKFKPRKVNLNCKTGAFCDDLITLNTNDTFKSAHKSLVGGPNPKTLIPPIIAQPILNLEHWRANETITHSGTNSDRTIDTHLSGYDISKDCRTPLLYNKPVSYNNVYHGIGKSSKCHLTGDDNMRTQILQPGVYSRHEVNEPINSNLGISQTLQLNPTTYSNGMFVEHDPSKSFIYSSTKTHKDNINQSNVYDPRFSGYGDYKRCYVDNMTGQPRYYYDDVNSVRMPNYISRSKIDFLKNADSYGPMTNKNRNGNIHTNNIRQMAHDNFIQATSEQRINLQNSLMRKRNNELQQVRQYPMYPF